MQGIVTAQTIHAGFPMSIKAAASVLNEYAQPIGVALPQWAPRPAPQAALLQGRYCRLEKLEGWRHAEALHAAYQMAPDGRDWTYMPVGPFADRAAFERYLQAEAARTDRVSFAVVDVATNQAVGTFALMRIDAANGVVEVGAVAFSLLLQRTRMATEAHFLLMGFVFEALGYRRYEWKCDSLNTPSRKAAERLGFRFEGIFRQALVYKGRNRDTAWFSILDGEWPMLRNAFISWLAPQNFDEKGCQLTPLKRVGASAHPEA